MGRHHRFAMLDAFDTKPRVVVTRHLDATRVIILDDTLTLGQMPDLQTRLESILDHMVRPRMILDLRACHYMPTTTIGVFVSLHMKITHLGGILLIVNDIPRIHELFMITRLDRLFHLHDSVESAMDSLASGRPRY